MKDKKTLKPVKAVKSPKTYPVPEWMDAELKPMAERMDIFQRHIKANELEKEAVALKEKAEQLREFSPPHIPCEKFEVYLRPVAKRAVIKFAEACNSQKRFEAENLSDGIRWILEAVLPHLKQVAIWSDNQVRYSNAEGLERSNFTEKIIGAALDEFLLKDGTEEV